MSSHVDSPKVVMETCERRGMFCSGYHASQAALAPKGYLTGAEWNWEGIHCFCQALPGRRKTAEPGTWWLEAGMVRTSPYGTAVGEAARQQAEDVRAQLMAGTFVIFKGPLQSNTGTKVIPAGEQRAQTDLSLESMDWLVEGVIGSTK